MDLRADEHVIFEGHPSFRALLSFYVQGLLAGVVIGVIAALVLSPAAGVLVGGGIIAITLVIGYVRRLTTKYTITNRRLRIHRGFVARKVQETQLDRVQNVNFSQGVIDRLLRAGTVDFDTAGSDDSEFRFEWVSHPDAVVRAVDKAQSEQPDTPEPERAPG